MEEPSGAVKTLLEMTANGEVTAEEVITNAEPFSQDDNPFRIVVGRVYLQAIPFLQQSQQAEQPQQ